MKDAGTLWEKAARAEQDWIDWTIFEKIKFEKVLKVLTCMDKFWQVLTSLDNIWQIWKGPESFDKFLQVWKVLESFYKFTSFDKFRQILTSFD